MKTQHDWSDISDFFAAVREGRLAQPAPLCRHNGANTCESTIEEKKFFVPTGKFRVGKKSGKLTEEKIPMVLQTATVTVTCGDRTFQFTATNRGTLVRDHRDGSRKTAAETRAELARLLGEDKAADAMTGLLLVLPDKPRAPKPDTRVFSAPDPNRKPERLYGHGEPKPMEPVSNEEFMAYLNAGLPENWESLPEIRELPSRTH